MVNLIKKMKAEALFQTKYKPVNSSANHSVESIKSDLIDTLDILPHQETRKFGTNGDIILEKKFVDENGSTFDATYNYKPDGTYSVSYLDGVKNVNIQFNPDGTSFTTTYENGKMVLEKITMLNGNEIVIEHSDSGKIEKRYSNGVLQGVNISDSATDYRKSSYNLSQQLISFALAQKGESGEKFWNYISEKPFKDGVSTPWCACFISWVTGNITYNGESFSDIIGHEGAGVYGFVVSAYEQGRLKYNDSYARYAGRNQSEYTPKAGDIVIFDWDVNWTLDPYEYVDEYMNDHIGIVESVKGNQIVTIEGNADGEIKERTYNLSDGEVTCFIDWQE